MRSFTYKTVPTGFLSATRGLESVFEFNGLVINDRRSVDRYKLSSITGLDDAEVRDAREANADYDGETAFSALYGGRTITMTGEIQAGNLDYLRYMQHQLKAAFDDVSVERELLIRWYDWYDNFSADTIAIWKQDYTSLVNVGSEGVSLGTSGRQLIPSTTQFQFIAVARKYESYQNTLKFHTGTNVSATIWLFGKWTSSANHMELRLTATGFNIYQYSPSDSGTNPFTTVTYSLLPNTDYWLRMRQDGIYLHAQLFTSDPDSILGATPVAESPVGQIAHNEMGVGSIGGNGFGAQIANASGWYFDALDVRALSPGDMVINCKKVAKVEGTEGWNGLVYRLPFMITLRASSPLKQSRVETTMPIFGQQTQLTLSTLTFPAGGTGIPFDSSGTIYFGGTVGTAKNLGFAPAYPTVRFIGPLLNPAVANMTNGTRVAVSGSIAANEFVDIYSDNRIVLDKNGNNRYGLLDITNTWLRLDPGDNQIMGATDEISGGLIPGSVRVSWRSGYR